MVGLKISCCFVEGELVRKETERGRGRVHVQWFSITGLGLHLCISMKHDFTSWETSEMGYSCTKLIAVN